jgi:hypothetical protein
MDATSRERARTARRYVAAWVVLGIALAVSGIIGRVPQAGPLFLLLSCGGWVIAYLRRGGVYEWARALPLRGPVAVHAIRLPIGAAFVWEASRGQLAPLFAERAGYGDIAIGVLAMVVTYVVRPPSDVVDETHTDHRTRAVVIAFSILGLVDILVALGTGMYLMFVVRDPSMLGAIARLPYPLLPFLIVPSVILTHLLVLHRLMRPAVRHAEVPEVPRV